MRFKSFVSNVEGVESLYENIYKVTFKKFVCYVGGVKGSEHMH